MSRLVRTFATALAITPDKGKRGSGFQQRGRNHHGQVCFPALGLKHWAAETLD